MRHTDHSLPCEACFVFVESSKRCQQRHHSECNGWQWRFEDAWRCECPCHDPNARTTTEQSFRHPERIPGWIDQAESRIRELRVRS